MKSAPVLRQVERRILLLRGQNVILDFDLAELYGVETRALKQAVRRNLDRFPADFMFELARQNIAALLNQCGWIIQKRSDKFEGRSWHRHH